MDSQGRSGSQWHDVLRGRIAGGTHHRSN